MRFIISFTVIGTIMCWSEESLATSSVYRTPTAEYKTSINTYKRPAYTYKYPGSAFRGEVTCENLASQNTPIPITGDDTCGLALRSCFVYQMMLDQQSTPIVTDRGLTDEHVAFAEQDMKHKLMACQLILDAVNSGNTNLKKYLPKN